MRHEIRKDLDELEAELLAAIDLEAERIRARWITTTPSQPAIYLEKEREAQAVTADPEISDDRIPHIAREAARTGRSRLAVAGRILAQAEEWRRISAEIEDLRLAAKDCVRAAATVAGKRAAAAIDWTPVLNLEHNTDG